MMADFAATDEVVAAKKRSPRTKTEVPDGWVARGFTFEVAWPDDHTAVSKIRSQFGGRRFAYNWALAQVKADMDAKKADPTHVSVPWNLYALRKRFNAEKHATAPW
jgi:putative transposase